MSLSIRAKSAIKKTVDYLPTFCMLLVGLYALLAPSRIKTLNFWFSKEINAGISNEIFIFPILIIIIICCSIGFLKNNKQFFKRIFITVVGLSILFTNYFFAKNLENYLISLFFVVPPFLIITICGISNIRWKQLLLFFSYFSTLYGLFVIAYGLITTKSITSRPAAMLGSSISISIYLLFGSLCLIYLIENYYKNKKVKGVSYVCFFLNLAIILLLQSRLAFLNAIILLAFLLTRKIGVMTKIFLGIIAVVGLSVALITLDIGRIIVFGDSSSVSRLEAFKQSFSIWLINPVFGTGMGGAFPRLWQPTISNYHTFEGYTILVDPHNVYAMVIVEFGLIGILIFIGTFIYLFYKNRQIYKIMFLVILLTSLLGGSFIFNEISLCSLLAIMGLSLFNTINTKTKVYRMRDVL